MGICQSTPYGFTPTNPETGEEDKGIIDAALCYLAESGQAHALRVTGFSGKELTTIAKCWFTGPNPLARPAKEVTP